ncbi:glycoside hydrolase family 6 protein [Sorangium sp. So ce887]|uniref:glycoside hydrolase family 6 protein n=1 Tax=Sorangium sp. So ce887 TaxID=3133324 RepID=UPI003F635BEF
MLRRNSHQLGLAKWVAVLLTTASFAACSGDGGGGSGSGEGGAGSGAGTPTGSGAGAGTPTGSGAGTPTGSGAGAGTPTGSGAGTPTGSGAGAGTPTSSTAAGGNCPGPVDISTADGNPFVGGTLFVDPEYIAKVQSSIDKTTDAALVEKMKKVQEIPTAFWLDRIAAVDRLEGHLDAALALQNQICEPVIPVIVVYDLPNRDCFAEASNGELRVENGGVKRYREEFIDRISAIFAARPNQRIVAIIEPDSLPNLATNLGKKDCTPETDTAYRENVAYALQKLDMPHVHQYIDAAHSGWLGWADNQKKGAEIFASVIEAAGNPKGVRGFATNVANYTQLSYSSESYDQQDNPCFGEYDYVDAMASALAAEGLGDKHFIIDTSRNGRGNIRSDWGFWCNNEGAGMGERPRANPGGATRLDAFYWVKPPGDSDGTADTNAERYDLFCGYENADQRAPEAGVWFHEYFVECVKNANPPL